MTENNPFDGSENSFSNLMQSAVMLHEMYTTLVAAGFTEDQAMRIIAASVAAAAREG